jgi:hypothetical protein
VHCSVFEQSSVCIARYLNNPASISFVVRLKFAENALQESAFRAIIGEAHMPLSPEQEMLCDHLDKDMPSAAALIRQQAQEIDARWDRLSHAYALVRRESPAEMIQEETEALPAMLAERQRD